MENNEQPDRIEKLVEEYAARRIDRRQFFQRSALFGLSLGAAGTMMGTAAMIVMDETTSMPNVARRLTRFYDDESCGQCTPCREGTAWAHTILRRLVNEGAEPHEIELLLDICDNMGGRTICALADAAVGPIKSTIEKFRSEYEAGLKSGLKEVETVCRVDS